LLVEILSQVAEVAIAFGEELVGMDAKLFALFMQLRHDRIHKKTIIGSDDGVVAMGRNGIH
jgi:hypothetical protein